MWPSLLDSGHEMAYVALSGALRELLYGACALSSTEIQAQFDLDQHVAEAILDAANNHLKTL